MRKEQYTMDDIMQAKLYEVFNHGSIFEPVTGGIEFASIGDGQFRCELPDGRSVVVDQFGTIIG